MPLAENEQLRVWRAGKQQLDFQYISIMLEALDGFCLRMIDTSELTAFIMSDALSPIVMSDLENLLDWAQHIRYFGLAEDIGDLKKADLRASVQRNRSNPSSSASTGHRQRLKSRFVSPARPELPLKRTRPLSESSTPHTTLPGKRAKKLFPSHTVDQVHGSVQS